MVRVSNGIVLKGQIFKLLSKKLGEDGGKKEEREEKKRRKKRKEEMKTKEEKEEKEEKQLQHSIWGQLLCL